MLPARHLALAAAIGLAACGAPSIDEPADAPASRADALVLTGCTGAPAGIDGTQALRVPNQYDSLGLAVHLAPAHPQPAQVFYVVLEAHAGVQLTATARLTTDAWTTTTDRALSPWCVRTSGTAPSYWGLALGPYPAGTNVDLAVHVAGSGLDTWLNNGGANYRFEVRTPPALQWVGDTHLRIAGNFIPVDLVPAGQALQVYTQTWPMGAAHTVEVGWRSTDGQCSGTAPAYLDADHVGTSGVNAQWAAVITASQLRDGKELQYWVHVVDYAGTARWDSNGGANYRATPRRFTVHGTTGFGYWRPTGAAWGAGYLVNPDGTTAIGCENYGTSTSSYTVRAVRVNVPGLTDRTYAASSDRLAAAGILRVEAITTAAVGAPVTTQPAFATQDGSDFIYTYFPYTQFCAGGGDLSRGLADGRYGYRLRFSTDGGTTWLVHGTTKSATGGDPIPLEYGVNCSYFNDPFDCHPSSSTYYTFEADGGTGGQGGFVLRFDHVALKHSVADWRIVTNRSSATVTIGRLALKGPDASLFKAVYRDPVTLHTYTGLSSITLAPGKGLRVDITYKPTRASGSLPHMASIDWTRPVTASTAAVTETVLYLRGTTP